MQDYSDPERENDPTALPDIETFQLTAHEVAESVMYEEEQYEFLKRHEFRLATMNSATREAMLDAMIEELSINGGWFWHSCFPGCLPDSDPFGPFETEQEALEDAQDV
ncbi:MAG: hypothetical protein ACR2QC_07925 [Gammaproteobacteria bacterium]